MATNKRFFVSTPILRKVKIHDGHMGFRIVDGPHFTEFAAQQSAKVLGKKFGDCIVTSESPFHSEDPETEKIRVIFPQGPANWVRI